MTNNLVKLRFTQNTELETILKIESDPEHAPDVGAWSHEEHEAALHNQDLLHLVIENKDKKLVGYAILAGVLNDHYSLELKRIVITEKGKGYGKAALAAIKELAFEKLEMHRLWLDVREKNLRAQHVYEQAGFKKEGLLRECIYYQAEFESLIVMSILSSEYQK